MAGISLWTYLVVRYCRHFSCTYHTLTDVDVPMVWIYLPYSSSLQLLLVSCG